MDDYQSMNFEFPDENIMLVTDYEEPGQDEGPEEETKRKICKNGKLPRNKTE